MSQILRPIEFVVAWIMVGFHTLLTDVLGMAADSGWAWALSIVGLVVVIRIVLIPLFVKQIKASRGMQLVAPEIRKIQQRYKGKSDPASRQKMQQETMAVYREAGTNPFASCLPILLQAPIFFALFRVLNGLSNIASGESEPIGAMTRSLAQQAESSTLLGASLNDSFLGTGDVGTKVLTVVLIVLMSVTTFTTQRQLMTKNMPAAMSDNPMAQQQKILMYVLPLVFAISGVNFPIGVLIYWLTTNVWSMGQQFYVIRNMPAPGSQAEQAYLERKARRKGVTVAELTQQEKPGPVPAEESPRGQRVQPRRKDRQRGLAGPPSGGGPADRPADGGAVPGRAAGTSKSGSAGSSAAAGPGATAGGAPGRGAGRRPSGSSASPAAPRRGGPANGPAGGGRTKGGGRSGSTAADRGRRGSGQPDGVAGRGRDADG